MEWPKGIPFTYQADYLKDIHNLKDLAIQSLPPSRQSYKQERLTGTKQLNDTERQLYDKTTALGKIVCMKEILQDIYLPLLQELQSIPISDEPQSWAEIVGNIHPTALSTGHSSIINCELDTQTRAHLTIFRPSLLLLHQVMKHRGMAKDQWPELGNASFGKVNPDGRLCLQKGGKSPCVLTIEYKTPFAMRSTIKPGGHILKQLQEIPEEGIAVGQAMCFRWPTPNKLTELLTGDESTADSQTRIIIQVCVILCQNMPLKRP